MSDLIYLASPYNHQDKIVMTWRWHACAVAVAHLLKQGLYVYSPILHNHPVTDYYDAGRHWDFWAGFDSLMLSKCSKLYRYKLPGWDKSVGLTAEVKIAEETGIEVVDYTNNLCNTQIADYYRGFSKRRVKI